LMNVYSIIIKIKSQDGSCKVKKEISLSVDVHY
jgi:hypothetical protein